MLSDALLVWRFKCGSSKAFCRIYEKYWDYLLTLAGNLLNDPCAAEDVIQDVFLAFAQSVESFELKGSLKAYLATCVANRSRDTLRRTRRQKMAVTNNAKRLKSTPDGPVKRVVQDEQLWQLGKALNQLPHEQREAIMLRLHGGLRFAQIAKLQEVPIRTVESRCRYGFDKLRQLLNGEVAK
jgi:RNA polymerase sigma-70 factor (ECF subfamily)